MKIEILNYGFTEDHSWILDQLDIRFPRSIEMLFSRKEGEEIQRFMYLLFNVKINQCNFKCSTYFGTIKKLEIINESENLKQCLVHLLGEHKLDFTFESGVKVWKN